MAFAATPWIIATAVWVGACALGAILLVRHRRAATLRSEDGLLLGAIAFAAAAPVIPLVTAISGAPTSWAGAVVPLLVGLSFLAAGLTARRRRAAGTDSRLTFHEKSAGLTLVATAIVYIGYFTATWNAPLAAAVPVFIASVVLIVVIMIIGHIVIALFHVPLGELNEAPDERDRAAELHAVRNAYRLLAVGIWIVPILVIIAQPVIVVVNTALAVFILSELTRYASLLYFYRFGSR